MAGVLCTRLCLVLLAVLVGSANGVISHIPSPNICKRKSSNSLWANWDSSDCPPKAACVPISGNNTHGYCSCSLTPEYHKLEGSECVTSENSKALAVFFGVICVASFLLILYACQQLYLAHEHGVLHKNFMYATGAFSIPTLIFLIIHMVCQILLYTNVSDSRYNAILIVRSLVVVLEGMCVLAIVLLFGLSIHQIAVSSVLMQPVDKKRSRRIVVFGSIALNVILTILVTPLAVLEQWNIAVLIWGIFALLCLLLYNYTLSWVVRMDNGKRPSLQVGVRATQFEMALANIYRLSTRLLFTLVAYIACCIVLVSAWYAGKKQKNSTLLGVVYSWALLGIHASVFVGTVFTVLFLRSLVIVRSLPAASTANTASPHMHVRELGTRATKMERDSQPHAVLADDNESTSPPQSVV